MKRNAPFVLEIALWGVGAVLLAAYFLARAGGELERRHAIEAFNEARGSDAETPIAATTERLGTSARASSATSIGSGYPTLATPDQTHWSESRIQAYEATSSRTGRDPGFPMALLRIHRLAIEVPVYLELNERNLNRGASVVSGTDLPGGDGNVAIAAHRDGYFRALSEVAVGDVIELDTLDGSSRYRVSETSVVEPTDLSPLEPTDEPAVTLITCYPFYFVGSAPQRYIVRAVAVK